MGLAVRSDRMEPSSWCSTVPYVSCTRTLILKFSKPSALRPPPTSDHRMGLAFAAVREDIQPFARRHLDAKQASLAPFSTISAKTCWKMLFWQNVHVAHDYSWRKWTPPRKHMLNLRIWRALRHNPCRRKSLKRTLIDGRVESGQRCTDPVGLKPVGCASRHWR